MTTETGGTGDITETAVIEAPTLQATDPTKTPEIFAERDFNGTLTVGTRDMQTGQVIVAGELGAGTEIHAGRSFGSSAEINIYKADGLKQQIVFNDQDSGGQWEPGAVINLGFPPVVTLTEAQYDTLPTTIGDGAVGVAGFNVHDAASAPVNGYDGDPGAGNMGDTAVAEYYGEVELDDPDPGDPAADAYVVERRLLSGAPGCGWEDVTGDYTVSIAAGRGGRGVAFTTADDHILHGYEYRFTPVAGAARCVDVLGAPDVAGEVYGFTLDPVDGVIADLDDDGIVGPADLGTLIAAWGDGVCSRSDLNGDGDVDATDLGILIAAWNDPNTDPPEQQQSGQSSGSPVLDALGFASLETYIAWIETLTPAELDAHLSDLIELVQEL